jgi:hypothetical protein
MRKVRSWRDPFLGHRVYSATAGSNVGHNWKITDTSAAGTPTYAPPSGSNGRGLKIDLVADNEVENLCASFSDLLCFDIDDLVEVRIRALMNQAAFTTGSQLAFGLASARNDAIDSIAAAALFRVIGADSTTLVVVETDDGVVDKDDIATGKTLVNVEKDFLISFARGKADVRFFIGGEPVALGTTFDMSNYAAGLQPFIQLQKAANTNTDGVTIKDFEVVYREAA